MVFLKGDPRVAALYERVLCPPELHDFGKELRGKYEEAALAAAAGERIGAPLSPVRAALRPVPWYTSWYTTYKKILSCTRLYQTALY